MIEDDSGQHIRGYGVAARRSPALRPLVAAFTAGLLAFTGFLIPAEPAAADGCGAQVSWTGGDGSWTDATWSPQAPASDSAVFIPAGSSITGMTGGVCALTIQPVAGQQAVTLSGSLSISSGSMTIAPSTTL